MKGLRAATVGFALVVLGVPALASAQIAVPLMTAGLDLRNAPVGSYSDYVETVAQSEAGPPPTKIHQALVKKDSRTYTVETVLEGANGKVVYQVTLRAPITSPLGIQRVVGQHDDNPPMELDTKIVRYAGKPDPKALVGEEEIEVPGGRLKTKHYRYPSSGMTVDDWITDSVGVFRFVRAERKGFKPYKMELVRHGTDAKPVITKPAQPHDEKKWMAQYELMRGPTPYNWPKPRRDH
jgi:hypothetical protein